MSRELATRAAYPAAVQQVFELRTSLAWVALKADRLQDGSALVRRTERADGGVELSVSRRLPDSIPAFLQRFLPADGRAVQHESWGAPDAAGVCRGTWSVDLPGAPATLGGTSTLEPTETGSVQIITGTAKVSVPIIGGKAEQFIVDMTTRLMGAEAELLLASLSG